MSCPAKDAIYPPTLAEKECQIIPIHYGATQKKLTKYDELARTFGTDIVVTPTKQCIVHSCLFTWEPYREDGWKDCRCDECRRRLQEAAEKHTAESYDYKKAAAGGDS